MHKFAQTKVLIYNNMNQQDILNGAKRLGLNITSLQADQFITYRDLLVEWNERFNLTALTDDASILALHFLDSLTALPAIAARYTRTLDVLSRARPERLLTLSGTCAGEAAPHDRVLDRHRDERPNHGVRIAPLRYDPREVRMRRTPQHFHGAAFGAALLLLATRPRVAGALLAAATWVKVWPAAVIAAVVVASRGRATVVRACLWVTLVVVAVVSAV